MNDDLRQLEGEVEAMLARWSDALNVPSPPKARERLRAVVRQELNEIWLAGQTSPSPSPATLARVRRAVRHELGRMSRGWAGMFRRWQVRLPAAAAAIVIAMILVRQAGWLGSGSTGVTDRRAGAMFASHADPLALFVEAANSVWAGDPLTAAISTDLESLEEGIGRTRAVSDGVQDTLDDIGDRIDDLFDSEPIDALSRLESYGAGVVG